MFSGLPGAGKSTLAEAAGRQLRVPVFAVDWLLGSLTPFGGYHLDKGLEIGEELLTTLAFRQLALGQSAILDFHAEDPDTRTRWRSSRTPRARSYGSSSAPARIGTCTGHGSKAGSAASAGWHEGGNWANVERRRAQFPPWAGAVLAIDAVQPLEENLATVLEYVAG